MQETEEERLPTTTAELVAEARDNRAGQAYPDAQMLIRNLPVVLRGLCDFVLSGDATAYDVARALASIIDVVEHIQGKPTRSH